MPNADLRMFMDDLKKLIHGNHLLLVNNHPLIFSKKRRFKRLYLELDSIIQILFNIHQDHDHQHHELEKVRNLEKRFKDAAEEAQDTIDLFLSALHFRNIKESLRSDVLETWNQLLSLLIIEPDSSLDLFLAAHDFRNRGLSSRSDVLKTSLDLNKILESIKCIKVELKTINIRKMKIDSSSRIKHVKTQSVVAAARTSYTRNPTEEIVVGLDHDAEIIRDKLTEDSKHLCVASIVGMGGLGKTTLATKLFNDPFIKYRFHIRAWATVSQTYQRRDLLIQILVSIGVQEGLDQASDSQLREKLHKKLMGRRYLIVIDDIWRTEAWDELKTFFPHDNTASRILLTTRQNEVALHVKPHGFVHSLPCLTKEESWALLKQKVFHGDECPEWLIKPGMQIAKKCHGLPLSVVLMAGVLAQESTNQDFWEHIACSVSSYIVADQKGWLETLALSYHHLPDHLRECFIYLGGFPEDFRFLVEKLIWIWVAEGFIKETGNRSLEDTAKAYLKDLISRNLVIVAKRNEIGDVKTCKLHDLVRELCVQKAKEGFFLKIDSPTSSSQLLEGFRYKQRRMFTRKDVAIVDLTRFSSKTIRSVLCFYEDICSFKVIAQSFMLLRVLNLQECRVNDFPKGLELLVHLRYLAIWYESLFPESICELWSLQTLILQTHQSSYMQLPRKITDLVNLRHLWSNSWLLLPYIEKPLNLHSISMVILKEGVDNFQKYFPNIKKLVLYCDFHFQIYVLHLKLLPYLENLKLRGSGLRWCHFAFPATLKKLSLISCKFPWSHMSIIGLLPNLEVLNLRGFLHETGRRWDACEQRFRQLKFLKLELSNIKEWKAFSTSFPCLKHLTLRSCKDLEEIPLEIGEIVTLEVIEIDRCSNSVVESVKRIQQEQHDAGNYELKIIVNEMELSFYLSRLESLVSEYVEFMSSRR